MTFTFVRENWFGSLTFLRNPNAGECEGSVKFVLWRNVERPISRAHTNTLDKRSRRQQRTVGTAESNFKVAFRHQFTWRILRIRVSIKIPKSPAHLAEIVS